MRIRFFSCFRRHYGHSILSFLLVAAALTLLLAAGGCEDKPTAQTDTAVPVRAALPQQRTLVQYIEATGTTEASARVDLIPRITGTLHRITYTDGALVDKGTLLFVIDPAPFTAKVAQAQGEVDAQEAVRQRAAIEYSRNTRLYAQRAASQATVVSWREQLHNAEAALASAKAALQSAEISLEYAFIRAPFRGHVSRHTADVGTIVGPTSPPLASIMAYAPIYASFTAPASRAYPLAVALQDKSHTIPVQLAVGDGPFTIDGVLTYASPAVDAQSGTLGLRATFPNTDERLLPGLFVRLRVPVEQDTPVLVVPRQAVMQLQDKYFVYAIVNERAVLMPVHVGISPDPTHIAVPEGLTADSMVIFDGMARIRPGQKVRNTMP